MIREYDCNLCGGAGIMMAKDTQAETVCGPYAFKCWCRYGDAKLTNITRWQRSLETRYKPILGVLIEREKETPAAKVEEPQPAKTETTALW